MIKDEINKLINYSNAFDVYHKLGKLEYIRHIKTKLKGRYPKIIENLYSYPITSNDEAGVEAYRLMYKVPHAFYFEINYKKELTKDGFKIWNNKKADSWMKTDIIATKDGVLYLLQLKDFNAYEIDYNTNTNYYDDIRKGMDRFLRWNTRIKYNSVIKAKIHNDICFII